MSQFTTAASFTPTPVATLLDEGYTIARRRADEWYLVENLPHGSFGEEALAVLPEVGRDHRVVTQASVQDQQLVQIVNPTTQIWWVKYRVPVFGGGARGGSRTVSYPVEITVPTYTRVQVTAATQGFQATQFKMPASRQIRVLTFATGLPEAIIAQAVAPRKGKVVEIDGIPYQFDGYSARDEAGSTLIVQYQFSQDCQVPAIPAGAEPGSDVSIPAKPAMHEYRRVPSFISPSIAVVSMAVRLGTFNISELPT